MHISMKLYNHIKTAFHKEKGDKNTMQYKAKSTDGNWIKFDSEYDSIKHFKEDGLSYIYFLKGNFEVVITNSVERI